MDSHDNGQDQGRGVPEGNAPRRLSEAELKRRRTRSLAIAWFLVALVILFFLVTLVRLGGNVANRPL